MDSQQGSSREPHLLNLKVMRLSRPALAKHPYPFALEPTADSSDGVSDQLRSALAACRPSQALSLANSDPHSSDYVVPSVQDLSLTPMLTLPSSFGAINLGETFSAVICLSNDAPAPVGSARLVASMVVGEIQPPPPSSSSSPSSEDGSAIMKPGQNMEMMISCEMRELGLHILQCAVEYASPTGPRTFTRSYRFNVSVGKRFTM
jgi:trafficking protein particle complex subunit 13